MPDPARLDTRVPTGADPDAVYDAFAAWVAEQGLELYPHQDEAVIELLGGNHVVLATPTGSGKSLVAIGAHLAALAQDKVSFYTAPIKALVSEKFFALIEVFGADNVGMLTGDAAVNPDAPIICCTAEVLANIALREGRVRRRRAGGDGRVPLLLRARPRLGVAGAAAGAACDAQFLLMSATLGDVSFFVEDLKRRTGRDTAVVDDAERPVPLTFTLVDGAARRHPRGARRRPGQGPVYVVHFTQAAAVEHATTLLKASARPAVGEGRQGGDRRADRRLPLRRRLRQDAVASWCATGSASTTPGCCRSTDAWSRHSRRPGCSASSAAPTPSASASTCRSAPCCSPGWPSSTATGSGCCGPASSSRSPAGRAARASTRPATSSSRRPST